jgi:hypothetical protein
VFEMFEQLDIQIQLNNHISPIKTLELNKTFSARVFVR